MYAKWVMDNGSHMGKQAAFGLMLHLSRQRHPEAAVQVGRAILRGDGTKKDPFLGLDLLYQACVDFRDTGTETFARGFIGEAWSSGELGEQRVDIAVRHMEIAADYGDGQAAFNLGIYFEGKDRDPRWQSRPTNKERAAHYYQLASDHGNVKGRTNLGVLHYCGVLANSDPALGARHLRQAAEEGDAIAADALTRIPRELARAGLEVPKIS